MVSDTSARPRAGRSAEPAKMTSSIFDERTVRGPWAPNTQATASTTFDLPLPFGPTTTVTPGSRRSVGWSAKDLKPFSESDFRNTAATLHSGPAEPAPCRGRAQPARPAGLDQAFFVSQKTVSISLMESRSLSATAVSLVFFDSPAVFVAFQNRSCS